MADNPYLNLGKKAAAPSDNPYLNLGEEKGSYFSGDQGLVPDAVERFAKGTKDTFLDIGKGMASGIVSVPQGIAELGALGIDAALDTNLSRGVTDAFEYIKPELGTAGEVTEDLVAFGAGFIPIAGWLGKAGQAAKAANAGRALSTAGRGKFAKSAIDFGSSSVGRKALGTWAGLTGSTAAATLGYSTAVANDGRATLSDNFAVLPDALETEEDTGLTGRSEAARRFRNKLRVGVEDAMMSGAFDTALKGAAMGSRAIGGTETAAKVAGAVRAAPSKVSGAFLSGLASIDQNLADKTVKGMKGAQKLFNEYFTASGGAPARVYETAQDARSRADTFEKLGLKAAEDWSKAADNFMKAANVNRQTPVTADVLSTKLGNYLLGDTAAFDNLPGNTDLMKRAADKMIDIRSELDDRIITQLENVLQVRDPNTGRRMVDQATGRFELKTPETPAEMKALEALNEIRANHRAQDGYLRRRFEMYKDPVKFYRELDLNSPQFNDAVNEVASNFAVGQGRPPNAVELERAKRVVLDTLNLGGKSNVSPEKALEDMRGSFIRQAKGEGVGLLAKEKPMLSSIDDIFVARREALDYSPKLRELMGEITDPKELYVRTVTDMAQASAAADLYAELAPMGIKLSDALPSIEAGARPSVISLPNRMTMTDEQYQSAMQPYLDRARDINAGVERSIRTPAGDIVDNPNFVTPEQILQSDIDSLTKAGWRSLGQEADIQHVFGGQYGQLTGNLVSPEVYSALTSPIRLQSSLLGGFTGMLSSLRSLSQKMTIVPNPGAQVRNIVGNMGMLAANANLGRDTDFTDMFKLFTSSLDTLDEAGLERLAKKISLTGVADTSLVTRALKEYRDAGKDLGRFGTFANAIDKFSDMVPFMKQFEKVYAESDTFFKGLSVLGEEKKLRNAFNAAGFSEGDPRVLQALKESGLVKDRVLGGPLAEGLDISEIIAGDIVKDTMPIYPRVGKAVRAVDMVPIFGNFTSFASENIRNSVNILDRGLKEMSFTISPELRSQMGEQAAAALEKEIRAMGAQRLMSYTAVAAIVPQTLVKAGMSATGTTPEELEAMRMQLPEYMDGHDLVILGNDHKGKIDYIDLSYANPYAFVLDPAKAAIQAYSKAGKLDQSEVEQIMAGASRGLQMFVDPFASESMIYERLRDVLPSEGLSGLGFGRGGKSSTGAEIYSSVESKGDQISKGVGHILNGVIPEYARLIGEFKDPFGFDFEPGRVYRAVSGLPGKRGEEYDMFKEGARLVTGFTPMTVDLRNDFKYKGLEYTPRRTDAKSIATGVMKRADATLPEMQEAWSKYLDNLYREQSKLYVNIQAARQMGLSDTDIRKNLIGGANLGRVEANAIMNGEFWPTAASKELWKDLVKLRKQEGRTFRADVSDFSPFNQMSRDRARESLAQAEPTPAPRTAPVSNPYLNLAPPASETAPIFNPYLNLTPVTPAAPPVSAPQGQVNPIILGNDPATQALAKSLGRSQ